MDKIIRLEGILKNNDYKNLKKFLYSKKEEEFPTIYINLKTKYKKDSGFVMILEKDNKKNKEISVTITDNKTIILTGNYLFIESILGLTVIKISQQMLLINIDREYIESESRVYYHKEKIKALKYKFYLNNTNILYNQIIYCNFNNEEELLIATYCLFLLLPYDFKYISAFDLYEQKLNYIGYSTKYFQKKYNLYDLNEIERIIKESNSSKDILNYLIGLVTSINRYVSKIYRDSIDILLYKFFLLKFKK